MPWMGTWNGAEEKESMFPEVKLPKAAVVKGTTQQMEVLCEKNGHWIWDRDEGLREMFAKTRDHNRACWGYMSFMLRDPVVHEWYSFTTAGHICVRRKDHTSEALGWPGWSVILDPVAPTSNLDSSLTITTKIEGQRIIERWKGDKPSPGWGCQMDYAIRRELVNDELVVTWVNKVLAPDMPVKTIFRRYPCFSLDNQTGKVLTMRTYPLEEPFGGSSTKTLRTLELDVGHRHIDLWRSDAVEERVSFNTSDGRTFELIIAVDQAVVLDAECFGGGKASEGWFTCMLCRNRLVA